MLNSPSERPTLCNIVSGILRARITPLPQELADVPMRLSRCRYRGCRRNHELVTALRPVLQ